MVEELEKAQEPFRLLLMPDHPTPIKLRTHTAQPVPYLLYDSTMERKAVGTYNEKEAAMTGIVEKEGYLLINKLLGGSHVNS